MSYKPNLAHVPAAALNAAGGVHSPSTSMATSSQYRQLLSDYGPPSLGYTQVQWELGTARCHRANTQSCWPSSKSWGRRSDPRMQGARVPWRGLSGASSTHAGWSGSAWLRRSAMPGLSGARRQHWEDAGGRSQLPTETCSGNVNSFGFSCHGSLGSEPTVSKNEKRFHRELGFTSYVVRPTQGFVLFCLSVDLKDARHYFTANCCLRPRSRCLPLSSPLNTFTPSRLFFVTCCKPCRPEDLVPCDSRSSLPSSWSRWLHGVDPALTASLLLHLHDS